jgi:glycosyltransferase involved in cell wall biosynthesis
MIEDHQINNRLDQSPKIAFYIGSLNSGGSERHVLRLLEGLPNFGYRVALIVNSKSGPLLEQVTSLGAELVEFPISPKPGGRLDFILNTSRYLRDNHFDIVQGFNDITILYLGLAAKFAGMPVLLFALRNTHIFISASFKTRIIGWVCRNLVSGVIVNSHKTARQMSKEFRMPEAGIRVIHNGVQYVKDRQSGDAVHMRKKLGICFTRKTVGIVARLDPVKRVDTLIKTAVLLSDLSMQFLIVGDGQERANLESQIEAAGQVDRFVFVGNQKDPIQWISAFDIGILCSESEGFPQAILEYMAVGLPVVAPAVGGISELVIEGETGFLVQPNDLAALAAAIRRLINDPELGRQMGKAGQKRARVCFSREKEILAHATEYRSLLNKKSHEFRAFQ